MGSNLADEYLELVLRLSGESNISNHLFNSLFKYYSIISNSDELINLSDDQNSYSKPMPWIGMYIALASLFCILAMVADLIHGLRNRKLWFPCKYFTINAASLTVIAVAMKLPVDLNNPMPGDLDQAAKLGSVAFMCTIMANFLPSLASMDNKELFTNIIALDILVITLVVNVCIQMKTGVVREFSFKLIAIIYVFMLLMLLIIQTCSALTILKSKQILELKYQAGHETALKDLELQQPGRLLTVEKLKQHVSNYWIMAETSSPQFMIACSVTTNASGVICALSTTVYAVLIFIMYDFSIRFYYVYENISIIRYTFIMLEKNIRSDYKWSMIVIFVLQFIGVIVGTIAPLFRCFADLSFKLSIKWIWNHIKVFKVESYWTQKLCDWKQSRIPFSVGTRKSKILFQFFKIISLNFCVGFQRIVVVACKMMTLIPLFFVICVLLCIRCLKWLKVMFNFSDTVLDNRPGQHDKSKDLSQYVLQHQDGMEVAERTLKKISNSVNRLIKKAEKQQPSNLMKLLEGSRGFEGVELFDSHHVPPLLSEEALSCWRLPLVTLTSIAISLPNIQMSRADNLLRSVSEGLVYVTLVEESLNATDEYVGIQKAADMLWLEVEVYHKWLGNKLPNLAPPTNTTGQILQWFKDTAKNMVTEVNSTNYGSPNDNSIYRSICANSMYRITETILLSYNTNIEEVSHEELFMKLSSMISDILSACLTNLPQVIKMKCHESVIEKREASVHAAAQLLGETTQIINSLQDRELPSLNPDELPFIDNWRATLMHPSP